MNIQTIFTSYKHLIGFMVLCIFVQMLLGDNVLYGFLWLVLMSMLIINAEDFINFMQGLQNK